MELIFYGAGVGGKEAFFKLRRYSFIQILAFCDSDESKWGKSFLGRNVISPEEMQKNKKENPNIKIIITAEKFREQIAENLNGMGIYDYTQFNSFYEEKRLDDLELYYEKYNERCIDLGAFLQECIKESGTIYLKQLPFIMGGARC